MQPTCLSFGLWSYDVSSSSVACAGPFPTELFGYGSLTVGDPLYTVLGCDPGDVLTVRG